MWTETIVERLRAFWEEVFPLARSFDSFGAGIIALTGRLRIDTGKNSGLISKPWAARVCALEHSNSSRA